MINLANAGRKPYVDRTYVKDEYVQKWLVGLAEKTKNKVVTTKLGLGPKAKKHREYRCVVCDSVKKII